MTTLLYSAFVPSAIYAYYPPNPAMAMVGSQFTRLSDANSTTPVVPVRKRALSFGSLLNPAPVVVAAAPAPAAGTAIVGPEASISLDNGEASDNNDEDFPFDFSASPGPDDWVSSASSSTLSPESLPSNPSETTTARTSASETDDANNDRKSRRASRRAVRKGRKRARAAAEAAQAVEDLEESSSTNGESGKPVESSQEEAADPTPAARIPKITLRLGPRPGRIILRLGPPPRAPRITLRLGPRPVPSTPTREAESCSSLTAPVTTFCREPVRATPQTPTPLPRNNSNSNESDLLTNWLTAPKQPSPAVGSPYYGPASPRLSMACEAAETQQPAPTSPYYGPVSPRFSASPLPDDSNRVDFEAGSPEVRIKMEDDEDDLSGSYDQEFSLSPLREEDSDRDVAIASIETAEEEEGEHEQDDISSSYEQEFSLSPQRLEESGDGMASSSSSSSSSSSIIDIPGPSAAAAAATTSNGQLTRCLESCEPVRRSSSTPMNRRPQQNFSPRVSPRFSPYGAWRSGE